MNEFSTNNYNILNVPAFIQSHHAKSALVRASHNSNIMSTVTGITKPTERDILLGRGAGINCHSGNIFYRSLIQKYKPQYLRSDPPEKKLIVKQIVQEVDAKGYRFLKKQDHQGNKNVWDEISFEAAKRKTAQALRENAPGLKKKQEEEEITTAAEVNKRKRPVKRKFVDDDTSCDDDDYSTQSSSWTLPSPATSHSMNQDFHSSMMLSSSLLMNDKIPCSSTQQHQQPQPQQLQPQRLQQDDLLQQFLQPRMVLESAMSISSRAIALQKKHNMLMKLKHEIRMEQNQIMNQLTQGRQQFWETC